MVALGEDRFSWSAAGESLTGSSHVRRRYIAALQAADAGEVAALMAFARS